MTNLLFITIDDLFSLSAWPLYDGIAQTPHLDALAARGINFDAAYADVALCNPSRAAILTGQTPWQTGVLNNGQELAYHVDLATETLPGILKSEGYHVTLGGKVFHSVPPDDYGLVADMLLSPEGMRNTSDPAYDNVMDVYYGAAQEPLLDTDLVARASNFLAGLDGTEGPQAIFAGIYRPHADWVVPQEFIDLYDGIDIPIPDFVDDAERAEFVSAFATDAFHGEALEKDAWEDLILHYLASVSYADALLGQLLEALEASAIADDTVVMVMSDHGYHLGDAEIWHKFTTHEQSARTPLMMLIPDGPSLEVTAPVNLSSVAATTLELLDIAPSNAMQPSLLPLIETGPTGEEQAITWMNGSFSLRTDNYRYTRYENGEEDLFDISTDIYAQNNLADERPDLLAAFRAEADILVEGMFINPTEAVAGGDIDNVYYMIEQVVPISDTGGYDLVVTNVDYTLPDGIEALTGIEVPVHFIGNALDNQLSTASGNDTIHARGGNDNIFSSEGSDLIYAGAGHDRISAGGSGSDTVEAGGGNDTIIGLHGSDLFFGRSGNDELYGGSGSDSLYGGNGNDILFGSVGNDHLNGDGGDDILHDGNGQDMIRGGSGDDTLRLGEGRDTFDGGGGRDMVEIDLRIESLEQTDWLADLVNGVSGPIGRRNFTDLFIDVEDLHFWSDFKVIAIGTAGDNAFRTDAGDDELSGGRGDDVLRAGAGDDTALGGSGADLLAGEDGADLLRGGQGADTLEGGAGSDALFGQRDADHLSGGAEDDTVNGGGGADTLFGGDGADFVKGGGQADLLSGDAGDDKLIGASAGDTLLGGAGDDVLKSGGGDDRLEGGAGDDRLKGGPGRDLFVFDTTALTGADRIIDFEAAEDTIHMIGVTYDDLSVVAAAPDLTIAWDGGQVRIDGLESSDMRPDLFDFG